MYPFSARASPCRLLVNQPCEKLAKKEIVIEVVILSGSKLSQKHQKCLLELNLNPSVGTILYACMCEC